VNRVVPNLLETTGLKGKAAHAKGMLVGRYEVDRKQRKTQSSSWVDAESRLFENEPGRHPGRSTFQRCMVVMSPTSSYQPEM
jgi:hypothetical protein